MGGEKKKSIAYWITKATNTNTPVV
jgi:hypothetical protein